MKLEPKCFRMRVSSRVMKRPKEFYISRDLTPQQREDDRKAETARKEDAALRTERAKNEGRREKWIVVGGRGRVVKIPAEEEAAA